jgi:mannose-P-dolichol utilization defect 1
VLETLSYAITLSYSFRNEFPFSTYGENFFLTLQNIAITLLIIYYPSSPLRRSQNIAQNISIAVVAVAAAAFALYTLPDDILSLLQLATLPLSVFSKLPQIRHNARAQSTGQLSTFAVVSQILGCLARLFTTATEVGDVLLTCAFALALLLNTVLGIQLWMYWGNEFHEREEFGRVAARVNEKGGNWELGQGTVDIVVPPQSPHVASLTGGRKWARKVD